MTKRAYRGSWIIAVCLGGVAAVSVLIFVLPAQRAIGRLNEERISKQDFIARCGQLTAPLQTTEEQLKKTLDYNKMWKESAPKQSELHGLFGRINALAKVAGAKTTRFDPQPVVRYDKICKTPLTVGLRGSFFQVFAFVCDLERLPQPIWIERLHVEQIGQSEGNVECDIVLAVLADNPDNSDQADKSE